MRGQGAPFRADRPAVAELTAGAVVADAQSGRVLLIHQVREDRWCLPKGHLEAGESVLEAARREVQEETGLGDLDFAGEIGQVAYRFYDPARGVNVFKTTVYFLALARSRTLRLEDGFDRAEWVTPAEGRSRVRYDTDRSALDAAERAVAPTPGRKES